MDHINTITEQILKCKSRNEKIECFGQYYITCLENVAKNRMLTCREDVCDVFVRESVKIFTKEMRCYKKDRTIIKPDSNGHFMNHKRI
jgi:hypothetical protein